MPRYTIRRYTYNKAKQLGLRLNPSTNKTKKIDVYSEKTGKKLPVLVPMV
jgi:hypothetical protein